MKKVSFHKYLRELSAGCKRGEELAAVKITNYFSLFKHKKIWKLIYLFKLWYVSFDCLLLKLPGETERGRMSERMTYNT